MAGHKVIWKEIPEDGLVTIGKKSKYWYELYKFKNVEQYNEWREWAEKRLGQIYTGSKLKSEMNYIDLRWGMSYEIPKETKKGEQTALPF